MSTFHRMNDIHLDPQEYDPARGLAWKAFGGEMGSMAFLFLKTANQHDDSGRQKGMICHVLHVLCSLFFLCYLLLTPPSGQAATNKK